MYAEIQAVIASTRLLADIITASKDLRNFNELAGAVSEVNAKLWEEPPAMATIVLPTSAPVLVIAIGTEIFVVLLFPSCP